MGYGLKMLGAGGMAALLVSGCSGAQAEQKNEGSTSATYNDGSVLVTGSGNIVRDTQPITNVDRLNVDGLMDVVIRQGAPSLTIEAEDNILPLVHVSQKGDTLTLATEGSFRTHKGIVAVLTVPDLDEVRINSSGDVRFDGWQADAIALAVHGSGDIELGGEVRHVRAVIGGSGDIDLAPVLVSQVDASVDGSGDIRLGSLDRLTASVNGSGDIEAGVVGTLDAQINGSGDIRYRSAARIVRSEVRGSGDIRRH